MARILTLILLSQIVSNGWWYCATQQTTIDETPIALIPWLSSIVLFIWFCLWIFNNWND